ncbi:2TM domain-containing protein [Flavobacterium sp. WC2509]|uniref:2TM domain-containing protein n=1 Tax=Flavobacterium sp. WC2509 TaxID=3461406 RepID=UPI004044C00B
MGQFRKRMYEDYRQEFDTDESYNLAYKKVKRIKGFYSHLTIYVIVNVIIIATNLHRDALGEDILYSGLLNWKIYSTALFWGIGLVSHWFSVFGRDLFFSHDWEQKKIQKYMEMEKENTNKWE